MCNTRIRNYIILREAVPFLARSTLPRSTHTQIINWNKHLFLISCYVCNEQYPYFYCKCHNERVNNPNVHNIVVHFCTLGIHIKRMLCFPLCMLFVCALHVQERNNIMCFLCYGYYLLVGACIRYIHTYMVLYVELDMYLSFYLLKPGITNMGRITQHTTLV